MSFLIEIVGNDLGAHKMSLFLSGESRADVSK